MAYDDLALYGSIASSDRFCIVCRDVRPVEEGCCLGCGLPSLNLDRQQLIDMLGTSAPNQTSNVNIPDVTDHNTSNTVPTSFNAGSLHSIDDLDQQNPLAALQSIMQNLLFGAPYHTDQTSLAPQMQYSGSEQQQQQRQQRLSQQLVAQLLGLLEAQAGFGEMPTSKAFLDSLHQITLTKQDFVHPIIHVLTCREMMPTMAAFGPQLMDLHDLTEGSPDRQSHFKTNLTAANPLEGNCLKNANALKDNVALFKRGEISFYDKSMTAQNAGAVAVIVFQSDAQWPFTMTNTSRLNATNLRLPLLMISKRHGEQVQQALESSIDHRIPVSLCTEVKPLSCSVCLTDYSVGSKAVKLPCRHYYCEDCIRPWLLKKNSCPSCRYQLPTDKSNFQHESDEEKRRRTYQEQQLHAAMYN